MGINLVPKEQLGLCKGQNQAGLTQGIRAVCLVSHLCYQDCGAVGESQGG